jgi:hypothetical protein
MRIFDGNEKQEIKCEEFNGASNVIIKGTIFGQIERSNIQLDWSPSGQKSLGASTTNLLSVVRHVIS